jgi:hypothetical protein
VPANPNIGRIINGVTHDSSSITATINSKPYSDITEISYSDSLEPGILQGVGDPYIRARTRGQYKAEASFTIAKSTFELIKSELVALGAGGFAEATFPVTVIYRASVTDPIITDIVEGCRIMKVENSHSAGNSDALVVKIDLSVVRIRWNGFYAVADPGTSALIGL